MRLGITTLVFASCLLAQRQDWMEAGNRALDRGSAEEAASDLQRALEAKILTGAAPKDLLGLRVTLATAYMEAGAYREAEAALDEAQKTAWQLSDGVARAELLNAWSVLHLRLGKLAASEAELLEAQRILIQSRESGDILPTVLHNLAAIEMRTGRYAEALSHDRAALVLLEKTLRPDHPSLIRCWASLGSVEYLAGQRQEARISLDRAIASAEKTYGADHPLVADLLDSEAVVLDGLKLKKEARRARGRARRIRGTAEPAGEERLSWNVRETMPAEGQVYLRSK
jgi:tetratricopeptide (TPR) repeat protein